MGGLKQSAAAAPGLRLAGHTWRVIDTREVAETVLDLVELPQEAPA